MVNFWDIFINLCLQIKINFIILCISHNLVNKIKIYIFRNGKNISQKTNKYLRKIIINN
jgi:hypothetical protein